jgi:hypothetical protein
MRCAIVVAAAMLLCGCGGVNSPWGLFFGSDDQPVAAAGTDGKDGFVITTRPSGDPRVEADHYCGKQSRYARLVSAEHSAGADPATDVITWHFECAN